jgi:hypothetical protein
MNPTYSQDPNKAAWEIRRCPWNPSNSKNSDFFVISCWILNFELVSQPLERLDMVNVDFERASQPLRQTIEIQSQVFHRHLCRPKLLSVRRPAGKEGAQLSTLDKGCDHLMQELLVCLSDLLTWHRLQKKALDFGNSKTFCRA